MTSTAEYLALMTVDPDTSLPTWANPCPDINAAHAMDDAVSVLIAHGLSHQDAMTALYTITQYLATT